MPQLSLALLALLGGCSEPEAEVKVFYFPTELDLAPATYDDDDTPWMSLGLINESYFPLDVQDIEINGIGAKYVDLEVPGGKDDSFVLDVRDSAFLRLRVGPPAPSELVDWATTVDVDGRDAPLEAKLTFRITGTPALDPATGEPDRTQLVVQDVEIPVWVRLDCDRDDDGADAVACSNGGDCEDAYETIYPGADEICDEIDNDCDGSVDDNGICIDLDE